MAEMIAMLRPDLDLIAKRSQIVFNCVRGVVIPIEYPGAPFIQRGLPCCGVVAGWMVPSEGHGVEKAPFCAGGGRTVAAVVRDDGGCGAVW